MLRRIIRQMLSAQIFSALTISLCLLIDNIIIGRFLGQEAVAAYGFASPLLLAIGAIGSMLAAGIQIACGKSLGRGSIEETDAGYSSAIALAAVISVVFAALVVLLRAPLTWVLGAGREGIVNKETQGYLAGFSLGAPASMGALVLVPFLQLAGKSGLLIAAVLSMTVADIALDLLSVTVFHGGMFGIGLASSLSYYIAMGIAAVYFLSKKSVFHFRGRLVTRKKIAELFRGGIPAGFNMASSVFLVFGINRILKGVGGDAAVAAYAVVMSLSNAANCITTGTGGVSLSLGGILYHEEDRTGLRELIRYLTRSSVLLGGLMGLILLFLSPLLVSIFLPDPGETRHMAVEGLRFLAAGLIPCCINNALKSLYQATEREWLTEVMAVAEGFLFPLLAGFVCSRLMGVTGVWLYYVLGELLTLAGIGLYIRLKTGGIPWKKDRYLLLRKDFGAAPENLMEMEIHNMEEVVDVSERAKQFCLAHGQTARVANHLAVCIEERAANTVQHGFAREKGEKHLSLRILFKTDYWVLRFRDDCRAFDPLQYVPAEGEDALGLRLIQSMASEANYTYSLNLNNLMLKFPSKMREVE